MLRYRESKLIRNGVIGVVLIAMVISIGLQPKELLSVATAVKREAVFVEAGGLQPGDDVKVSGVSVGSVTDIALREGKAVVTFAINAGVRLGDDTSAHIRTGTLLGQRMLDIEPAGSGAMTAGDQIPVARTSSPYTLTQAVSELTSNTAETDTAAINQSLNTLSDTIDRIAPTLGPTFESLTRLSGLINERDDSLRGLLAGAADVTGVLAERSQQVNSLILDANELLAVLEARRYAIVNLLAHTSALTQQISAMIGDNEAELAPALQQLNRVLEMLERNRDNIAKALSGLAKYQVTQGESVNNGFYYSAYVGNLPPGGVLQPFLDYAFGMRRPAPGDTSTGGPPPRAEFPIPKNGIPGGSR